MIKPTAAVHPVALLTKDKVRWQGCIVTTYKSGRVTHENIGRTQDNLHAAFKLAEAVVHERRRRQPQYKPSMRRCNLYD